MDKYDSDTLNDMCSKVNLLEYAENTMEFKRNGNDSYVTRCPLHVDATPSLSIRPSKNMFHCFSCNKSGNILTWLMVFEHLSFNDAIDKVSVLTGMDVKKLKQCSCMKEFKQIKRVAENGKEKAFERKIIDNKIYESFSEELPAEWIEEGITVESMRKYGVKIDNDNNRIIYPVYDSNFNLIGIKGRTRFENFKMLGIPKYMNYYPIGSTDFLQGMKESYNVIKEKKKCIIFEGIKSVMKADAWGYDYCVSAETSYLNDAQVKALVRLGVKDVTICFDSDVDIKKVIECTKMLKRFCNVYVVRDRRYKDGKLLGEKEAPVDKGKEVFETLLMERMKI